MLVFEYAYLITIPFKYQREIVMWPCPEAVGVSYSAYAGGCVLSWVLGAGTVLSVQQVVRTATRFIERQRSILAIQNGLSALYSVITAAVLMTLEKAHAGRP